VLTGSVSTYLASGNTLTLNLAIGFTPAYDGTKTVYGYAQDVGGTNSGWQSLGTWTVSVINQAPQAVSVTPSSGSWERADIHLRVLRFERRRRPGIGAGDYQ
jgi:hypothetical protein